MTGTGVNEQARRLWDRYASRYDRQIRVSERLLFPGGRSSSAPGAALSPAS